MALAGPREISVFEGGWPGGSIGLWRMTDQAVARASVAAAGAPGPRSFALSAPERPGAPPPPRGAGLMLVQGMFTDPAKAAAYNRALPPIYVQYRGFYLALSRPDAIERLAGDWEPQAIVLAAFADPAGAAAFWNSPEYAAAKRLREGGGNFRVIAFPGL